MRLGDPYGILAYDHKFPLVGFGVLFGRLPFLLVVDPSLAKIIVGLCAHTLRSFRFLEELFRFVLYVEFRDCSVLVFVFAGKIKKITMRSSVIRTLLIPHDIRLGSPRHDIFVEIHPSHNQKFRS